MFTFAQATDWNTETRNLTAVHRVLVVEYRDEVYAALRGVLTDAGLCVRRVDKADEAENFAEQFAPDLVLINDAMPRSNGWLVARRMKRQSPRREVWLYGARWRAEHAEWKGLLGVDEVIEYAGDLLSLVVEIEHRVECRIDTSEDRETWEEARGPALPEVARAA